MGAVTPTTAEIPPLDTTVLLSEPYLVELPAEKVRGMSMNLAHITINNNEAAHRFEAQVEGQQAFVEYVRFNGGIIFSHTEVPPALEGRGLAGKLAQAALEYARREQLSVVPMCPYVASYIRRHTEYESLVDAAHR